ncbi:MAG: hypothetical protein ACKOEO_25480 [Planctomycetaceae bacterium]
MQTRGLPPNLRTIVLCPPRTARENSRSKQPRLTVRTHRSHGSVQDTNIHELDPDVNGISDLQGNPANGQHGGPPLGSFEEALHSGLLIPENSGKLIDAAEEMKQIEASPQAPQAPPVTASPVTAPPVTEPPVTEPPVTDPPVTEPPA